MKRETSFPDNITDGPTSSTLKYSGLNCFTDLTTDSTLTAETGESSEVERKAETREVCS